ncbi:MFS family permease [Algoriphagus sp. 4150]|uniref:MFS transporter n=1 Tax=Algoriphagus sp. 4150 TaxID=2817756 RepID=UPI0028623A54|nr:MFS transporter [Algoriphagus sp. 4150]MDR7128578.1 MFS family permease [Algoriphagus sp. 4150]
MNRITIYYALIVPLSGLLFGFDTVVISGANLPIKALWKTSDWFHGFFIMSVALWGTLLGVVLGSISCDKFGRKNTLFRTALLFFVSAVCTAMATYPHFSSIGCWEGFPIFLSFMVLQLLCVLFLMPETKVRPLECIQTEFMAT